MSPDWNGKPFGVARLEVFRAIGREPVDSPTQAAYLDGYTKNPIKVPFEAEHNGLTATYFARWVTRTSLKGPWSFPVSMTIVGPQAGAVRRAMPALPGAVVTEVKAPQIQGDMAQIVRPKAAGSA